MVEPSPARGDAAMVTTTYPVADSMRRAQLALEQHMRELEQIVAHPEPDCLHEMRMRLKAAMGLVKMHFQREEQDGYMTAVMEQDTRYESDVECRLNEHREMRSDLAKLVDEADALPYFDHDFSKKVLAWIERFREHEKSEIDLVQEAFAVEVGGEGG
jgi:hypothetical protein